MSIFQHVKTGNYYLVLESDAKLESTLEPCVVYRSIDTDKVWVQPCSEFFDGRFAKLETIDTLRKEYKEKENELRDLGSQINTFRINCSHLPSPSGICYLCGEMFL